MTGTQLLGPSQIKPIEREVEVRAARSRELMVKSTAACDQLRFLRQTTYM